MEIALIGHGTRLFGGARGQGHGLQHLAALRPMAGRQGARRSCKLIEVIKDGPGVDEDFAGRKFKGRNADQRIDLLHFLGLGKHRNRVALKRHVIVVQRNRNATHKRRVILANKDHGHTIAQLSETVHNLLASDQW